MRTIAHISDLHFGRLDPPVAEGLVGDLTRQKPDLLVVSGDFTQRAREGQFRQAADYLKRLPTPQLVIPGNHDVPLFDVFRRFFVPSGYTWANVTTIYNYFGSDELFGAAVDPLSAAEHRPGYGVTGAKVRADQFRRVFVG